MVKFEPFFFAFRRDILFCLSKIKYPNKKTPHTTGFAFPALLIKQGVCGTRAFSAQTVLDETPFIDCVARRGARGLKSTPYEYPSFQRKRESIMTCHSERSEESSFFIPSPLMGEG